jgi:hypothetical protein
VKFLLGCPEPSWAYKQDALADEQVPLFISYSRLRRRKSPYPRARVPYYIDSSGFMMLSLNGSWTISPEQYVADVLRYGDELGPAVWVAPQDWMCEPWIVAKTGLTVREHQRRTITNFIELCRLWREQTDAPCPFIPVLQGWTTEDYRICLRMYADASVDLHAYKVVGLGSVCRRQDTDEIEEIVDTILADAPGLRLHGFGIKEDGIKRVGGRITSSDSQAPLYGARRRNIRLDGCTAHKNCNYCPRYALTQYRELAKKAAAARPRPHQINLMRELELAS